MPLITQSFIDRYSMRAHPDRLYVYGDNLDRAGKGGQAFECRGEANALGLITKRRPSMLETAFLRDTDLRWLPRENNTVLHMLRAQLNRKGTVIWPEAGIGTGLADLATKAPKVLQYYVDLKTELERIGAEAEDRL